LRLSVHPDNTAARLLSKTPSNTLLAISNKDVSPPHPLFIRTNLKDHQIEDSLAPWRWQRILSFDAKLRIISSDSRSIIDQVGKTQTHQDKAGYVEVYL
jgi:hypothetical protein